VATWIESGENIRSPHPQSSIKRNSDQRPLLVRTTFFAAPPHHEGRCALQQPRATNVCNRSLATEIAPRAIYPFIIQSPTSEQTSPADVFVPISTKVHRSKSSLFDHFVGQTLHTVQIFGSAAPRHVEAMCRFRREARARERPRSLLSWIGLKARDPYRPIREADIAKLAANAPLPPLWG